MKLTVIGSGTSIPSAQRASPCLHLAAGGQSALFDAGSGSLRALAERGIDIRTLDAVFLTHFHPDHTGDLVPLLFALKNPELGARGKLLVGGPTGTASFMKALDGVYGSWIRPEHVAVDIADFAPGRCDSGFWSMSCALTGHTPESIAYRIEDAGRSVVVSGDTPWSDDLVQLAGGADLLVLECSFPEGPERNGHLIPSQAGCLAHRAGVRRLLLTHFYPAAAGEDLVTPCASRFDGDIVIAEDGLIIEV